MLDKESKRLTAFHEYGFLIVNIHPLNISNYFSSAALMGSYSLE